MAGGRRPSNGRVVQNGRVVKSPWYSVTDKLKNLKNKYVQNTVAQEVKPPPTVDAVCVRDKKDEKIRQLKRALARHKDNLNILQDENDTLKKKLLNISSHNEKLLHEAFNFPVALSYLKGQVEAKDEQLMEMVKLMGIVCHDLEMQKESPFAKFQKLLKKELQDMDGLETRLNAKLHLLQNLQDVSHESPFVSRLKDEIISKNEELAKTRQYMKVRETNLRNQLLESVQKYLQAKYQTEECVSLLGRIRTENRYYKEQISVMSKEIRRLNSKVVMQECQQQR